MMTEATSIYGPVADDIERVGRRLRDLSNGHHLLLAETLAHVFDTGGKRIRPALVMLSGKLARYDVDRLITLAASLEVVHSATLVHDDTLDQALTRRGLMTVSALWNGKVAVLVGDFLFAQSAYLAAQLNSVRIMRLLSETVMAMSGGELRQYASSQARLVDEEDYLQRIAGKTASLFGMCCEGAAIVSGQDEEQIAALRTYGINLGMAFQIADDVLDFSGDDTTLGKPAGSDLRQGTVTLPAILFAARLPAGSPVLANLRNGVDVEGSVRAVRESGVLDEALERANEYGRVARSALNIFPDSEPKQALLRLIRLVISRQS